MTPPLWDPEDHARALRTAARQALLDDVMQALGVTPPDEPITEPIPVIRPDEAPPSWLTAG
ncbi:hypothetical protein [Tsukamurella sp. 1534]|uniref:hypothetical protein n=1 Tax=Tsukamurella sp. 1534 TaxID=1151061 RepID=UPI0005926BC4|nr:hypothetical protein [Tsukamurella sp. 1534]